MAINLRFAFVCAKKWNELSGDDPKERFCDQCERTVLNLDPLTEMERERIFRDAIRTGKTPCVSATIATENGQRCAAPLSENGDFDDDPETWATAGEPILDDDLLGDEVVELDDEL